MYRTCLTCLKHPKTNRWPAGPCSQTTRYSPLPPCLFLCLFFPRDTDSIFLSLSKRLQPDEIDAMETAMHSNTPIPYCDTLVAKRFSEAYVKSLHRILDYSSISEVYTYTPPSHIHKRTYERTNGPHTDGRTHLIPRVLLSFFLSPTHFFFLITSFS